MYNIIYTYSILYCYLNQVILYTYTFLFFSQIGFNYSLIIQLCQCHCSWTLVHTCTYMYVQVKKAKAYTWRVHILCIYALPILLSLFIELTMTVVYLVYRLENKKFHNKIILHAQWYITKCLNNFKIVKKKLNVRL